MDNIFSEHFSQLDRRLYKEQFFIERLHDFWTNFPYSQLKRYELLELIDSVASSLIERKSENDKDVTQVLELVLDKSLKEISKRISEMRPAHVSKAFNIMNALNLNFGDRITNALTRRGIELTENVPSLSPRQALNIFITGANVNLPFLKDDFPKISDYILKNLGTFDLKDSARCFRSCAIYELRGQKFELGNLISTLQKNIAGYEFDTFNDLDKNQLYDSQTVMNLPVYFNRVSNPGGSSFLEKEFLKKLEDVGAQSISSARYVGNMFHEIDIAIEWKRRLMMLEIDGPYHYINTVKKGQLNVSGYDGGTILQSALLRKSIPEDLVVRVSFTDLIEIVKSADETSLFLDKCLVMPNGVYKTERSSFGVSISHILPESRAHIIKEFNPPPALEECMPTI